MSNTKKKSGAGSIIIFILLLLVAGGYLYYTKFMTVKPDVKINGVEIRINEKISEIEDDGFILVPVNGGIVGNVPAESFTVASYKVMVESGATRLDTGVVLLEIMNASKSEAGFEDCAVKSMYYNPSFQDDGVEVLINGKDMHDATRQEWADFFREMKYPFKDDEITGFANGDDSDRMLIGKGPVFTFTAEFSIYDSSEVQIKFENQR